MLKWLTTCGALTTFVPSLLHCRLHIHGIYCLFCSCCVICFTFLSLLYLSTCRWSPLNICKDRSCTLPHFVSFVFISSWWTCSSATATSGGTYCCSTSSSSSTWRVRSSSKGEQCLRADLVNKLCLIKYWLFWSLICIVFNIFLLLQFQLCSEWWPGCVDWRDN